MTSNVSTSTTEASYLKKTLDTHSSRVTGIPRNSYWQTYADSYFIVFQGCQILHVQGCASGNIGNAQAHWIYYLPVMLGC